MDVQANIKLMTSSNHSDYKNRRKHKYYSGLATKTPFTLQVPTSEHWYVTVDLGGYVGNLSITINLLT